jgi:hypothetical protein
MASNRGIWTGRNAIAVPGACLLGSLAVVVGNVTAVHVAGPAFRATFGDTYGYRFDYMTFQTWLFGVSVRGCCLAITFLTLGLVFGQLWRASPRLFSFAAANPVSLFVGLVICGTIRVGGMEESAFSLQAMQCLLCCRQSYSLHLSFSGSELADEFELLRRQLGISILSAGDRAFEFVDVLFFQILNGGEFDLGFSLASHGGEHLGA